MSAALSAARGRWKRSNQTPVTASSLAEFGPSCATKLRPIERRCRERVFAQTSILVSWGFAQAGAAGTLAAHSALSVGAQCAHPPHRYALLPRAQWNLPRSRRDAAVGGARRAYQCQPAANRCRFCHRRRSRSPHRHRYGSGADCACDHPAAYRYDIPDSESCTAAALYPDIWHRRGVQIRRHCYRGHLPGAHQYGGWCAQHRPHLPGCGDELSCQQADDAVGYCVAWRTATDPCRPEAWHGRGADRDRDGRVPGCEEWRRIPDLDQLASPAGREDVCWGAGNRSNRPISAALLDALERLLL